MFVDQFDGGGSEQETEEYDPGHRHKCAHCEPWTLNHESTQTLNASTSASLDIPFPTIDPLTEAPWGFSPTTVWFVAEVLLLISWDESQNSLMLCICQSCSHSSLALIAALNPNKVLELCVKSAALVVGTFMLSSSELSHHHLCTKAWYKISLPS